MLDRAQNQDASKLFPVGSSHRTTQHPVTLAQQQQMPQSQHHVVFNMARQQTIPGMPPHELPIEQSMNIYSSTKHIPVTTNVVGTTVPPTPVNCPQPQSVMPINAPHQQQIPGTGPINIDLGMQSNKKIYLQNLIYLNKKI